MDVLILVCALTVAAPHCQSDSATDSFRAPEPQSSLAGCLREGLMYAAQSRLVGPGTYPKVVCVSKPPADSKTLANR
jgi:hypothetical protein